MAKRHAAETVQVKVRMREDLRRKLERDAEKRGLTINAEILRRLDQSYVQDQQLLDYPRGGGPVLTGEEAAKAALEYFIKKGIVRGDVLRPLDKEEGKS